MPRRPNQPSSPRRNRQRAKQRGKQRELTDPAPSSADSFYHQPTGAHQPLGKRLKANRSSHPSAHSSGVTSKKSHGDKHHATKPPLANRGHGRDAKGSTANRLTRFASNELISRLYFQKNRRRRRMLLLRLATMCLAVATSLILALGWLLFGPNLAYQPNQGWQVAVPETLTIQPPPDMVLLLMGVDINQEAMAGEAFKGDNAFRGVRTDTMVLARITAPPRSQTSLSGGDDERSTKPNIAMISLPRDSKVFLTEGGRTGKINSAFAYGGAERAKAVVERLTGIPVDYTAVINLHGVADVVDALGGVDLTIDTPMHYKDRTGHLDINFEPGQQRLDGQKAVEYLRFRHDSLGDIGRIRRQQTLLTAFAKKLKDPWTLARLPGVIQAIQGNMQTDLPADLIVRLGWMAKSMTPHDIQVATLPGTPVTEDTSYWLVDAHRSKALLERMILNRQPKVGRTSLATAPLVGMNAEGASAPAFSSVKVGLIIPTQWSDEAVSALEEKLTQGGLTVMCRRRRDGVTSQLVEHRSVGQLAQRLGATQAPWLLELQHVVSPIGGTYENNFCTGQAAITIMLGNEFANL